MAFGFHIAEPNEALIISGTKGKGPEGAEESMRFKIITGDRTFVWPILQNVRALSLDLNKAEVIVNATTHQGIPVTVKGVIAFKVGDDYTSIANAARRFLGKEQTMEARVHDIFAGHVRGIVGSLTVEDLIREREKLAREARGATSDDIEKMGLIIDTLQIAEIDDPTGYIENLAKPQLAEVQRNSRIAQADNDRQATEKEAEAGALKAAAQRDSDIKQAEFKAQVDEANAEAAAAGPRAEAEANKAVVERNTEVAELRARQRDRELEAEVRRPADAEAYAVAKRAEGDKDARILGAEAEAETARKTGLAQAESQKAQGLAEGDVIRAKGEAEGRALEARAEGLAQHQDAVIGQQLAESMPAIVSAAASAFGNVDKLTILNGADGVTEIIGSLVGQAQMVLDTVRSNMETDDQRQLTPAGNGATQE